MERTRCGSSTVPVSQIGGAHESGCVFQKNRLPSSDARDASRATSRKWRLVTRLLGTGLLLSALDPALSSAMMAAFHEPTCSPRASRGGLFVRSVPHIPPLPLRQHRDRAPSDDDTDAHPRLGV